MRRWMFWLVPAVALFGVRPAIAAPMVRTTVSHLCCGACASAVRSGVADIAWIADVKADPASKTVTVMAKEGATVDVAALLEALRKTGFPPQEVVLTGAKGLEVNAGHLCCGGCVGPLKAALASLTWIESAEVKPNAPVRITVRGTDVKLGELVETMRKAGYSASSVVVIAS